MRKFVFKIAFKTLPLLCCGLVNVSEAAIASLSATVNESEYRASLSSFGSIGAGRVLTSKGTFFDYDTDWSAETDTIIGAQIDVTSSQGVTFTTQAVARGYDVSDVDSQYEPELELLFLAYQATDNLRLRGGLIRTPFFLNSESLEVGYAYPWVRTPVDVYTPHTLAVTHMKGIDASWYHPVGNALFEWRFAYGHQDATLQASTFSYDATLDPLYGSTFSFTWPQAILRYSYYRTSSSFSSKDMSLLQNYFQNLASTTDPFFERLATNSGGKDQLVQYHVLGGQYEWNEWTFISEFDYERPSESQFSVGFRGGYLSVARQIGAFSVYGLGSFIKSRPAHHLYTDLETARNIPAPDVNPIILSAVLDGAHKAYDAVNYTTRHFGVGVRYDINDHLDLKTELERSATKGPTVGGTSPSTQKMLTFVLDWVF